MSSKKSATFNHFHREEDGTTFTCKVKSCRAKFSVKRENTHASTRCYNLKRHLERSHKDIFLSVKKEDEAAKKPKNEAGSSTRTLKMFFPAQPPNSLKVTMTRDDFIQGMIELVVFQLTLFCFFKSKGFKRMNGEMAKQLDVCLDREAVRKFVLLAAERRRNALKSEIKHKMLFVKLDAATRLRTNYLAVNVQYLDQNSVVQIATLGVKDTENCHTREGIRTLLESLFADFEIRKDQVMACVVDNASNMTKTVQALNEEWRDKKETEEEKTEEDETKDETKKEDEETADEEETAEEEECELNAKHLEVATKITHMRCAMHTLQLAIKDALKIQHAATFIAKLRKVCVNLRKPNADTIIKRKAKKGAIIDQETKWSSTFYMIERLVELKPVIQDLARDETYLTPTQWEEAENLRDLLKEPQVLTLKVQAKCVTPGQFYYDWRKLISELKKKGGVIAHGIWKSMESREATLLENELMLAGIYVDARVRLLLNEEQCETAKRVIDVTNKTMGRLTAEDVQEEEAERNSGTGTEEESSKFERELSALSKSQAQQAESTSKLTLDDAFKEIEQLGRIKATNVWDIIAKYPQSIQDVCKLISTMPTTQVSVERLFSALKLLKSDRRASMKGDVLDAVLFLRVNNFSM